MGKTVKKVNPDCKRGNFECSAAYKPKHLQMLAEKTHAGITKKFGLHSATAILVSSLADPSMRTEK